MAKFTKVPFWVQKLLCYTIQHEGGRILTFDKCLYLRSMANNNCKTDFSLHVVESAIDDYNF